jgi:hypothetical protein
MNSCTVKKTHCHIKIGLDYACLRGDPINIGKRVTWEQKNQKVESSPTTYPNERNNTENRNNK